MNARRWAIAMLGSFCLTGCGPNNDLKNNLKSALGISLEGISAFAIGTEPTSTRRGLLDSSYATTPEAKRVLYAVAANGALTATTVADEETNSTTIQPLGVVNAGAFVFFRYAGVRHDEKECRFVAARKSDGALYCVTLAPPPMFATEVSSDNSFTPPGTPPIQYTADGRYVVMNSVAGTSEDELGLFRLDMQASGGPSQERIAGSGQSIFRLNDSGDVLVPEGLIYRAGGGLQNAVPAGTRCLTLGPKNAPNDFYVFGGDYKRNVERLKRNTDGTFTKELYASNVTALEQSGCSMIDRTDDRVIVLSEVMTSPNVIVTTPVELVNPSAAPVALTIDGNFKGTSWFNAGSKLVGWGNDLSTGEAKILTYDLVARTTKINVKSADLKLSMVHLRGDGSLEVLALRYSDATDIRATLALDATELQVLSQEGPMVIQLARID